MSSSVKAASTAGNLRGKGQGVEGTIMTRADDLVIPALGRVADLGYLYDARNESLYPSIFTETITDCINTLEQTNFLMDASITNSLTQKLSLFKIKAELGASILFGLLPLEGSWKNLVKETRSARKSEGTILVTAQTKEQHLDIYRKALTGKWNTDLLKVTSATHLVTGIKWGANVAISVTETFEDVRSKTDNSGKLYTVIDMFKANGSASSRIKEQDFNENCNFKITVYGDVIFPLFPKSPHEIKDFISKIPGSVRQGVRLVYTLVPVTHICQMLKEDSPRQMLVSQISDSINHSLIKICNDLSNLEQQLNDFRDDFSLNSICALDEQLGSSLHDLRDNFQNLKMEVKSKIKDTLVQVKSGQCNSTVLSDLIDHFNTHRRNVELKLQRFIKGVKSKSENVRIKQSQLQQAYGTLWAEDGSVTYCVNQRDYSFFKASTREIPSNHASFGCSGTIQLPSKKESIFLDFKLPPTNGSQQRCLWTLDASHRKRSILFKVKLTLLCQHPPQILDDHTLTFTECKWRPDDNEITTSRISASPQNSLLLSGDKLIRGFLSFNAKTMDSETGFILRVDVLDTKDVWDSSSNSSATHTESIGSASYLPPSRWWNSSSSSSIVINPQPVTRILLIVNMDFKKTGGLEDINLKDLFKHNTIKILEFGMDGVAKQVGRFCGGPSTVLYETKNPVAALVKCSSEIQYRIEMSWK